MSSTFDAVRLANLAGISLFEATRVNKFDPFQFTWQVYAITREHPFGNNLRMPGDNVAITERNGKLIAWFMFERDTPDLLGEFYAVSQDELTLLKLRKLSVTGDDLQAAWLYIKWDKTSVVQRELLAPQFLALSRISKKFKSVPTQLHRGMQLTSEQSEQLAAGQPIQLRNSLASSWTTNFDSACPFTGRKHGVIISKHFPVEEVVVNLHELDKLFKLPLRERWASEHEVLIKGNGVGEQLDPSSVDITLGNVDTSGNFLSTLTNT